jgi:type IV pilus assembly protein PilE
MPSSTTGAGPGTRPVLAGRQLRARTGLTLVDLVAALAIVALLACIAVPGYRAELVRTRRADARAALLSLAVAEEGFHTSCNAYASVLDNTTDSSCDTSSLRFPAIAGQGAYSLVVTSADAANWAAVATARAGGPQQADTRCRTLGLTSTGNRTATTAGGAANHAECWTR